MMQSIEIKTKENEESTMKKIRIAFISLCAVFTMYGTASAVDLNTEKAITTDYATEAVLQDANGLIELELNQPVTITFDDGHTETFSLSTNDMARSAKKTLTVRHWIHGFGTYSLNLEYSVTGNWSDRSVTMTNFKLSDYETENYTRLKSHSESIKRATGSNNEFAVGKSTGRYAWTNEYDTEIGSHSFDLEIQLDPADSSKAYIRVIKD